MQEGENMNLWLQWLSVYATGITALSVCLHSKARNSINFHNLVLLGFWGMNLVFIAWSGAYLGRQIDRISGRWMHYQMAGLIAGGALAILVSVLLSVWVRRKFYQQVTGYQQLPPFYFPGLQQGDFSVTVYTRYQLVQLVLLCYLFGLPLLVLWLTRQGYTDIIVPGVGTALLGYTVVLVLVTTIAGYRAAKYAFLKEYLIRVRPQGLLLYKGSAAQPLLFLPWTEIEGFRFKLRKGKGILQVYTGTDILLQLHCCAPEQGRPNGLRQFADFLMASFDREDIEKKQVFSQSLIAAQVTEVRNKHYRKPAETKKQGYHVPA